MKTAKKANTNPKAQDEDFDDEENEDIEEEENEREVEFDRHEGRTRRENLGEHRGSRQGRGKTA